MFLEEVEDLKDRYPDRFQLLHVLSREPQEVELFSGRLDADAVRPDPRRPAARRHRRRVVPLRAARDGRPSCAALLEKEGVSTRAVHAELFHVEAAPPVRRAPVETEDARAPG